jgi:hypothetical protein
MAAMGKIALGASAGPRIGKPRLQEIAIYNENTNGQKLSHQRINVPD